jgi:integrase
MAYVERRTHDFRVRWKRPDGTYDSKGGFLTEDEALDHGRDQETDVRRGTYYDRRDGDILLREWVPEWLDALDVLPNSVYHYHKLMRAQILPAWGELTLAAIAESPLKVRAWEKRLRSTPSPRTGRPLSANYVAEIMMVFRVLLEDAATEGMITASPIPKERRRRGRYTRAAKEEKVHASVEQVLALAENARTVWGLSGYVFVLTKAFTGMRLGEMFGLRREYCYPLWPATEPDPERKVREAAIKRYGTMPAVRVQWQYQFQKLSEELAALPALVPPKYGSRRTLVIPDFLAELLCDLLDSHDSEWVFPSINGGSLLLTDFNTYYWDPIVDGFPERVGRFRRPAIPAVDGLAGLVPHGLRHTQKVWLDEDDGHSRVAVEERMGHVVQGVEGVYSHVTPKMELRIARMLQELRESARGV